MFIAVLDDSPTLAEMIRIGLRQHGCTADVFGFAGPFMEAVKRSWPRERYDCIICDRHLTGAMDGVAVIASIHRSFPGLPAILMSGSSDRELAQVGEEADLPVISKPFEFANLVDLINQIIGQA